MSNAIHGKTVNDEEWKKYLEFNSWNWNYLNSRDTLAYLNKDHEQSKTILPELGMAK